MSVETGLKDKTGKTICDGNMVSLAGNVTSDNSLGYLPNGWVFEENDVYRVFYDESINNWSLKLGVKPDSDYNRKYMNHAISLLHDGLTEIVKGKRIREQ